MQRKLYFFIIFVACLSQHGYGWVATRGRLGSDQTTPYQSSNPKVELKESRTLNQEQAEECYLFSFVGAIESANLNGWNRTYNPEISAEFMFVEKLLAWSEEILTTGANFDEAFYYLNGGDIHHAMKVSVEKGLIPHELFNPKKPYNEWDMAALYKDVKDLTKEGRRALSKIHDEGLRQELLRTILKQIEKRISQDAGTLPAQFSWAGRNWTPHKFENAYGIKRNSHVYLLYPKGKWDMEDPWDLRRAVLGMVETFKGAFGYRQSTWTQIWHYIIKSLDNKLPVILSTKWAGSYHVLNAVGYEYNAQDEIVSIKLQNTWGKEYGDRGFSYFQPEDIEKNVSSVWGFVGR